MNTVYQAWTDTGLHNVIKKFKYNQMPLILLFFPLNLSFMIRDNQ